MSVEFIVVPAIFSTEAEVRRPNFWEVTGRILLSSDITADTPSWDEPLPEGGVDSIVHGFLGRAAACADAVAIRCADRRITYRELDGLSSALARRLRGEGLAAGDRIAIVAERGPELVWAMLAVVRMGGVFVMLDSAYPPARLRALAEIAAPAGVIAAGGARARQAAADLARACALPLERRSI